MADDSNAKPPPPEIIVEATDWPYYLRQSADPREQVRRGRQAVDERHERELELANKRQTVPARKGNAARRLREEETLMKAAEMVAGRETAWQVAGDALEYANKLRKLDEDYQFDELRDRDPIYRIVRITRNWSRLTSLR